MKIALKTLRKTIIEVPLAEIESKGFDAVWDDIRKVYSEDKFSLLTTFLGNDGSNDNIQFFEFIEDATAEC